MSDVKEIRDRTPPAAIEAARRERAKRLGLVGLLSKWGELGSEAWVEALMGAEEGERQRLSLERRIRQARLGSFTPLADFDWGWPKHIDRELFEELFTFRFLGEGANLILLGPNGLGKTMLTKNLLYQGVLAGHTARFERAGDLLNDLASQEGARALGACLRKYVAPRLLAVDEVGYLSFDNRHADLLFELVTRRCEAGRSMVITTNKAFKDWNETFPNAACVATLIDRLIQKSEVIKVEGESYRLREAKERQERRAKERAARRGDKTPVTKSASRST